MGEVYNWRITAAKYSGGYTPLDEGGRVNFSGGYFTGTWEELAKEADARFLAFAGDNSNENWSLALLREK
jgi:hypothetical protein